MLVLSHVKNGMEFYLMSVKFFICTYVHVNDLHLFLIPWNLYVFPFIC